MGEGVLYSIVFTELPFKRISGDVTAFYRLRHQISLLKLLKQACVVTVVVDDTCQQYRIIQNEPPPFIIVYTVSISLCPIFSNLFIFHSCGRLVKIIACRHKTMYADMVHFVHIDFAKVNHPANFEDSSGSYSALQRQKAVLLTY